MRGMLDIISVESNAMLRLPIDFILLDEMNKLIFEAN
jgi:hypothetical protein